PSAPGEDRRTKWHWEGKGCLNVLQSVKQQPRYSVRRHETSPNHVGCLGFAQEGFSCKQQRNHRQPPWPDTLNFYSATVEQVCQTARGISPQVTGNSVIITIEPRTGGNIDNRESACPQMPERGTKKRCVVSNMFDHVQEKNSVVVPQQRWCLIEYVVDEEP